MREITTWIIGLLLATSASLAASAIEAEAAPGTVDASTPAGADLAAGEAAQPAVASEPPPNEPPPRRGPRRGPRAGGPPAAAPKPDEKEEEEEEEPARWTAIRGADVHTITDGVHEGATVLIRNEVVFAIGRNVPIPEDATIVEAAGMHVYPGVIALESRGIVGRPPVEDTTDPFSLNIVLALASGVTTVVSGNAVAKLTYGSIDGMTVGETPWIALTYSSRNPAGKRTLRQDLDKVREYLRDLKRYDPVEDLPRRYDAEMDRREEEATAETRRKYRGRSDWRVFIVDAVERKRANLKRRLLRERVRRYEAGLAALGAQDDRNAAKYLCAIFVALEQRAVEVDERHAGKQEALRAIYLRTNADLRAEQLSLDNDYRPEAMRLTGDIDVLEAFARHLVGLQMSCRRWLMSDEGCAALRRGRRSYKEQRTRTKNSSQSHSFPAAS